MRRDIDEQLREMLERIAAILREHPAAVFLPCFYRAAPPRILIYADAVRVLVKDHKVLYFEVEPYDLVAGGYREVDEGAYRLAYEFQPGRRFEVDLDGSLLEKAVSGDDWLDEICVLRERLGFYDLVPLLEMRRIGGTPGAEVALRIKRLDPDIPLPSYAHPGDAGLDICSAEDVVLEPGERATVSAGFAMALPEGYAAFIQPRSGLAARSGISIVNTPGLIDCHYRGEVKVILVNLGREPFRVKRGDRVAQMVVQEVCPVRVEEADELDATGRGEGGFGSTGV